MYALLNEWPSVLNPATMGKEPAPIETHLQQCAPFWYVTSVKENEAHKRICIANVEDVLNLEAVTSCFDRFSCEDNVFRYTPCLKAPFELHLEALKAQVKGNVRKTTCQLACALLRFQSPPTSEL
ncbi:hypothetical protein Y032_0018g3653 [Ancylostoma ceylanicum]|uniref:Uncharacterized protein n=1 Tax=Ancylostoma ceylanicum TaxID=53326 RepID=A0A016V3H7_9BILA|nr:hypothetical protein Y032_0018g3653 [Ancylostoma ceylanicum]